MSYLWIPTVSVSLGTPSCEAAISRGGSPDLKGCEGGPGHRPRRRGAGLWARFRAARGHGFDGADIARREWIDVGAGSSPRYNVIRFGRAAAGVLATEGRSSSTSRTTTRMCSCDPGSPTTAGRIGALSHLAAPTDYGLRYASRTNDRTGLQGRFGWASTVHPRTGLGGRSGSLE